MTDAHAPRTTPSTGRVPARFALVALSVLLCALCAGTARAEDVLSERWRWVRFSTVDGLPSNAVLEVVETSSGVPWAATTRGVACYDGYRWIELTGPLGDAIQDVHGLVADRDGVVWVLADETLLRVAHGRAERVEWSEPDRVPRQLAVSADGQALALVREPTRRGRTPLYRLGDGAPEPLALPADLPNTTGASFRLGGRGAHIGQEGGLREYTRGAWRQRFPDQVGVELVDSSASAGLAMVVHPAADVGLWTWGPEAPASRRVHLTGGLARALATRDAGRNVVVVDDGRVLASTGGRWSEVDDAPDWMPLANSLRFRADGDLWVATRRGLYLCHATLAGPERWPDGPSPLSNRLHELIRDEAGTTWLGTADGVRGRRGDGTPVTLPPLPEVESPLVTGLAAAPDGSLWATSGGAFRGVRRWDGESWHVLREADDGTPLGLVHKVRRAADGSLWLLRLCVAEDRGMFEGGVFRFADGRLERWGRPEWFEDDRVYDMAESPDGSRWFLTWRNVLRVAGEDVVAVQREPLSFARGFGLAVDDAGHAWAGRRDGGLARITPTGELSSVALPPGYERVPIWELCFDHDERLWIATNDGLLCRLPDGGWWVADDSNRLPTGQLWPLLATDDGLLIGSRGRGVVQLDFAALVAPAPRIDDLVVLRDAGGAHVQWSVHGAWGRPQSNEIATRQRIDGGDWSQWAVGNALPGLDLDPGTHRVDVEARGELDTSRARAELEFDVPAPLHRRPAFYLPVGALLLALVAVTVRHRRRRRRDRVRLRLSEDRYRTLLSEAFDAISIGGPDGTLGEVNQQFCDLLGRTRPELVGGRFQDWFVGEDGTTPLPWPPGRSRPWLGRGRFGAAGEPPVLVEVAVQRMRDGSVLTVLRDLSERMALEYELERRLDSERELREEAQRADTRHAALATRLVAVQEEERTKLARALHDEIGQDLTAIKLQLEASRGETTSVAEAAEQVAQLLERVRELSLELHPSLLDDLGLVPAVLWNVRRIESRSDCRVDVRDDLPDERLPADVEIAAYRIVQEALTNVARHAGARAVGVHLGLHDGSLRLEIADDGRGFDHDGSPGRRGLGLLGMRERAESLGGTFEVRTGTGHGTTVVATLPVAHEGIETRRREPAR